MRRTDAGKFLYILNQMDTAAHEDNPEQIVGAWQRALAQSGLSAGQYYTIYDEAAAVQIENLAIRERFKAKRDEDMARIQARIDEVELHRNDRIASFLDTIAKELEHDVLPQLRAARGTWRRRVALTDLLTWAVGGALTGFAIVALGLPGPLAAFDAAAATGLRLGGALFGLALLAGAVALHLWARGVWRARGARRLPEAYGKGDLNLRAAFLQGTRWYRTALSAGVPGWRARAEARLRGIRDAVATHIQKLNDRYADPSAKPGP